MVEHGLHRLVGSLARACGDGPVVLLGQDLPLVEVEHVGDGGLEDGDAAAALDFIGEELAVGAGVPLCAIAVVEGEHGRAEGGEERHDGFAGDLREQVRLVECEHADEGAEIDAEQRVVHVKDDGFESRHGRRFPPGHVGMSTDYAQTEAIQAYEQTKAVRGARRRASRSRGREGFDHPHRSPGGLPPKTKKSHFMLEIDGDSTYSNEP